MQYPSFFVVGAAKSGTTALWHYFQQHPEIFVTTDIAHKELGYFSNQYGISDKEKYVSFFKDATPNQKVGEVCHVYLTSAESAAWIKKEVPNAKIIILLRNPVERAYSLYNWMVMHGYENCTSFKKALDIENKRKHTQEVLLHTFRQNYFYFSSGLYYEQVKRYFNVFGRENVLVMAHEDFRQQQIDKLNKIYNFIGVSEISEFNKESINKSSRVISVKLQYFCRKQLLKGQKRLFIVKLLNWVLEVNTINKKPIKMAISIKNKMENDYYDNAKKLSKLCKYDFTNIWFNKPMT